MIPECFGHYRVLKQLGAGGMGVVYLAHDEVLRRRVAIKLIHSSQQQDAAARARFLREARAVAALNHPNIAVLYEAGEIDGQSFLAMEYVEGQTLQSVLASEGLSPARWLRCATSLASALQHAHKRGILHRDIKSSNVILTTDDAPKLLDFGLARFCEACTDTNRETTLTAPGTWLGTVHYAAPEVLCGHPADFASDIYSLGVVLYEMACGRLPFAGMEGQPLIAAIVQGRFPPLDSRNLSTPAGTTQIVQRAMALRSGDRFSAAELVTALEQLGTRQSVPAKAAVRPSLPFLAILNFQNIGGDNSTDWLRTGMAETLTTDLQRVRSIRVVSPERIHALERQACAAGQETGIADLGKQVGAQWALTGSYQRAGSRLRITARVVEIASEEVVCTAKVDGEWPEIFELQDRLVRELMSGLQIAVDETAARHIATPETFALEAYEHYAQARKKFHEMGKTSLEEARIHFERALGFDPNYAVAHSGLGATYAMRYIHRTDPEDLRLALRHLEQARQLDPELGEPYPFLCYVYMRRGQLEEAISAGEKGVQLQPDLVQAHYFLGAAHAVSAEADPRHSQPAIDCLAQATKVEPGWEASWMILAEIAILNGNCDQAERYVERCQEMERRGRVFNRFLGADNVLGTIWLRKGELERAVDAYTRALKTVATADHAYREPLLALSACFRAEVRLRLGHVDAALADLHYAWRIVKEYPRMLGHERVTARTLTGLAAAYGASGQLSRARELAQQASATLQSILRQPHTQIPHTAAPHLCYAMALTWLRLGNHEAALHLVDEAVRTGWRDAEWMEGDKQLGALHDDPRFQNVLKKIRGIPAVKFPALEDLDPTLDSCAPKGETVTVSSLQMTAAADPA